MNRLKGRTALVTGSGRNIGRAIALKLAAEGANVVVNARSNLEEAESVAEEVRSLGVESLPVLADVADREQVTRMFAAAAERFGQVDVLVSNAAIRPHKPFTELALDDWERVRGVVLDGAFHCARNAIPGMQANGFGRIVFLTGDGAWNGSAERSHVSAAKMGVVGLARGLASEFAPHNIRVNVVSPGRIDTSRDLGMVSRAEHGRHIGDSAGPAGACGRHRRGLRVPGHRRLRLHHRPDHPRQRGYGVLLGACQVLEDTRPWQKLPGPPQDPALGNSASRGGGTP